MSTAQELHELNLVSSSKLKLRATAQLAEGTDEAVFEACVLFHEAARLERRAVDALSPCPPEARLAGSIEECWCLLEGHDPHAAADVWSRVLEETLLLPKPLADSMLSRLRPRYVRVIREFVDAIQEHPELQRIANTTVIVPASEAERKKTLAAAKLLVTDFPGVAMLWATVSRLEEAGGDKRRAWNALSRAVRLAPENAGLRALSLVLAAEALKPSEADAHLRETFSDLARAEPELCLLYAFSEALLAERSPTGRSDRFKRALTAVDTAFPRARAEWMTKNLTGVRLFLEASIAGRKADPDLLYRAGLGRLAATSGHRPIDALRAEATERVSAMSSSGAAA